MNLHKIILLLSFIMIGITSLISITIKYDKEIYELSFQELKNFKQYEIKTERDKNGVFKKETWLGASLKDILNTFSIIDFEKMKVVASDNYMVRFDFAEIEEKEPIIAYSVNGKDLKEKNFRLIAPQKRDMFWIRDISGFIVEDKNEMNHPEMIFIAENILSKMPLQTDPKPFKRVTSYYLENILEKIFPIRTGEYLLVSKDGVRHTLDFDSYLSKAVLTFENGNYSFKSPQMPAGMWIKNLAFIQKDEIGILFVNQFTNWQDIMKLMNIDKLPNSIVGYSVGKSKKIEINDSFDQEFLKKMEKLEW